jgi:Tfp pilus assembly protein PilF
MVRLILATGLALVMGFPLRAWAGLYYSGEEFADLPSQWSGFLLDQRTLRNIGVKPNGKLAASPARNRYQEAADKLARARRDRKLTADESADLAALYVRLGEVQQAIDVLRAAQRDHADHFRIAANLGTAWQLQGDLDQAVSCLQQAVRLAPGKWQKSEEYHLKLVRLRQRQGRDNQALDDLFDVRYVGAGNQYEPGKLAAEQRKKLPSDAVSITQQLALWLPADGRLLWQLAELANAHGDVKTAASIMDGCVNEFGLHDPELRRHRRQTRGAADELAASAPADFGGIKTGHEVHAGLIKARSKRPLATRLDQTPLPAIRANAVNVLPWAVLAETTVDRKFKPTFAKYLQELNGKKILLTGFLQPLSEELDAASFMLIEYPVGCWYCEMPEINSIVLVELAAGKTMTYTRSLVKVEGQLQLNATDPENFLYTISKAKVKEAD